MNKILNEFYEWLSKRWSNPELLKNDIKTYRKLFEGKEKTPVKLEDHVKNSKVMEKFIEICEKFNLNPSEILGVILLHFCLYVERRLKYEQ